MSSSSAELRSVAHGRPATEALATAIAAARADDPLAKVTVLVGSNLAGLSARRLLGSGVLAGVPSGVANVDLLTPFRLAELLAPVRSPGRNPLTRPVLAAAVRRVLATEPGRFAPVAGHEATEAALVDLYEELSHTRPSTRQAIASAGVHGASVVAAHDRIATVLERHENEDDLVAMATEEVRRRDDLATVVGHLVWWLPEPVTPAVRELFRALLDRLRATVIVGWTGRPTADEPVRATLADVGLTAPGADELPAPPLADRIISVSDADEEVRAVVRSVLELVAHGVPLDRIGVFHPSPDPYARTLHEQLEAAGIAHNGPGRTRLADTVAGRVLLGTLELVDGDLGRHDVLALCTTGPLRDEQGPVPVNRWDRITREAGVVGGLDDWTAKLAAHAQVLRSALATAADTGERPNGRAASEGWVRWVEGELDAVERLSIFVAWLDGAVAAVDRATSWADKAASARELLDALLGPSNRRSSWPDAERDSADAVETALARLAILDDVEPRPSAESFRRAVVAELDQPTGRIGVHGRGLLFGPLSTAVGQDLDAVFVLGMAEGSCPAPRGEDPLLDDGLRALATEGELATRDDELAVQERAMHAALAAAPSGGVEAPRRILTFPRGDLRSNRARIPSRWLLPTAEALAGAPVTTAGFAALRVPGVEEVRSYADGLLRPWPDADEAEHDTASVHAHVSAGGDPCDHPVVSGAIRRGIEAQTSREDTVFSEWDGNLAGAELEAPGLTSLASATRFERWAHCPFQYFLSYVLGLEERDEPDEITEIDARDRGSLLHEVLERFVGWAITGRQGGPPDPDEAWTADDRDELHRIGREVMDRYESEGRTGRPLAWRMERARIAGELDAFLVADAATRRERRSTPVAVEMAFGRDGEPPLSLELADGRILRFRGMIDRVDRSEDGALAVFDYKSSKKGKYKALEEDPIVQGTSLQLGLYAEAARARFAPEEPSTPVDARYWLVATKGENEQPGYDWDDERRGRMTDALATIADGIEAGAFPALPGEHDWFRGHERCRYCDFDALCPRDRADHMEATLQDPQAMRFLAPLQLPVDADADPGAGEGEGR